MNSKEHKNITQIYALLTVSILMVFIPLFSAALLSTIMFLCVWIAAYILRSKAEENSLQENHMTYIIRTIWILGLFTFISSGIASAFIIPNMDISGFLSCSSTLPLTEDYQLLIDAFIPCAESFVETNKTLFIRSTIFAGGPLVIYVGYRLAKGLSRALKGHRIGNVKNWF